MKAQRESRDIVIFFLTSTLYGGGRAKPLSGRFTSGKEAPVSIVQKAR
jgi:hypothetical protein